MSAHKSMRLSRLSFTGSEKPVAALDFGPALNVLYGGSNAGKSFVLKAVDFVLGSRDPFPDIKESKGYEHVFLSFTLGPEGGPVTIRRSTRGGAIDWYEGVANEGAVGNAVSESLSQIHGKGPKGGPGSLSERLLSHLGISVAKIAVNKSGALDSVTFRNLIPYVLVNEARMLGDDSALRQNSRSKPGADKNVFRFLLTGNDDKSIARTPTRQEATASKAGKIELLESMLADAEARLAKLHAPGQEVEENEDALASLDEMIANTQVQLDFFRVKRRTILDQIDVVRVEASELDTTLVRYGDLQETFRSDIRRLRAIEEGGYFLLRFDDQPCPLCGAAPGNQHKPHEPEELDRQHKAAVVEIAKIERDSRDLKDLVVSLSAQLEGLRARERRLLGSLEEVDAEILAAAPREASLRQEYLGLQARLEGARARASAVAQRDALQRQLDDMRKAKISVSRAEEVPMGIGSNIGHELSMIVADVLRRWEYPNVEAVRWDPNADDIEVNGYARQRNGKGVKAIFHSALKVAVLVYCRERSLPHPGFLFLDSPLVTYRKPIMEERHGPLSDDERAVRQTSLDRRFYEHLASLSELGQFIVVENADPPSGIETIARVEVFSGEKGAGRQGLFPPADAR